MDKAVILSKAPLAATIALAAGMAASVGLSVFHVWKQSQASHQSMQRVAQVQPQALGARQHTPDMMNTYLFGQVQVQSKAQETQTENLPTTNLRLELRGVSATKEDKEASALIEGPDKETQVYNIGDKLPGDATLKAIYVNRIVIERRGQLENLYFPQDEGANAVAFTSYDSPDNTDYQEPPQDYTPDNSGGEVYDGSQQPQDQGIQEAPVSANDSGAAPSSAINIQPSNAEAPAEQPAYVLDSLSEERKQEIRQRLQRLREQIINQ